MLCIVGIIIFFYLEKKIMTLIDTEEANGGQEKKIKPLVLNVSKKIVSRLSLFRCMNDSQIQQEPKPASKLTDQQIKSSYLYNKLMDRILTLEHDAVQEQQEHQNKLQIMNKMINIYKQKSHENKYELWELKNEVIMLEEQQKEEQELYESYDDAYQQYDDSHGEQYEYNYDDEDQQEEETSSVEVQSMQQCSINQILDGEEINSCEEQGSHDSIPEDIS